MRLTRIMPRQIVRSFILTVLVTTSRHQARSPDYDSRFVDESLHEPQFSIPGDRGRTPAHTVNGTHEESEDQVPHHRITLDVPTLPLRRHRRGASEASSFHASPTAQRTRKSRSPHPMRQHERACRRQHRRRHGPLVSRTDTSADSSSGPTLGRRLAARLPTRGDTRRRQRRLPARPWSCQRRDAPRVDGNGRQARGRTTSNYRFAFLGARRESRPTPALTPYLFRRRRHSTRE